MSFEIIIPFLKPIEHLLMDATILNFSKSLLNSAIARPTRLYSPSRTRNRQLCRSVCWESDTGGFALSTTRVPK
jgi:hypothetical protein